MIIVIHWISFSYDSAIFDMVDGRSDSTNLYISYC